MNRFFFFLSVLLICGLPSVVEAQIKVDTVVKKYCKSGFDLSKLAPPPHPKIVKDSVKWELEPCIPNLLKKAVVRASACAKSSLHLDSLAGKNSCTNYNNPSSGYGVSYCANVDSGKLGSIYVDIDLSSATTLVSFGVHVFTPLKNYNDTQHPDDPNLAQELVLKIWDDQGNLLMTLSDSILARYYKDTAYWRNFETNFQLLAGKKYQLQIFGRKPIYPNRSPKIWDFFGFQAVYECAELGKSCTWTGPELILVLDDDCEPANWYRWVSNCNDTFIAQVITIDTVGPIITRCQKDTMIEIPEGLCMTDFDVLPIAYFDECTQTKIVVLSQYGNLSTNGGILKDIRSGEHTIIYVVTDACGNSASCSFVLTVKEHKGFTLDCSASSTRTVSLVDSCARLDTSRFKFTATGLCCTPTISVRRSDKIGNGKYVEFCCSDVGKTIEVIITVKSSCDPTDSAVCYQEFEVFDKRPPMITCPSDTAVDCATLDTTNLDIYGKPKVSEYCAYIVTESHVITINSCKTGTIIRTWIATDASGNSASCSQTITIVDKKPFDGSDIIWPGDTILTDCHADYTPEKTGFPKFIFRGCHRNVAYSFKDEPSWLHKGGTCGKILRIWTVWDWCALRFWKDTQIITLKDNILPLITCPADVTLGLYSNCKTGTVKVKLDSARATDCNGILSITNNINANGPNASGEYKEGVHKIVFTATDGCGNTSTCVTMVTIVDKQPPTPYCLNYIIVLADMGKAGVMIRTWAKDADNGSYDNCCDASQIVFSYAKDSVVMFKDFTCADVGINTVRVWMTDCNGNQSACDVKIEVQDVHNFCPPRIKDTMTIVGNLKTVAGKSVNQVHVSLNAKDTLVDGTYAFGPLGSAKYTVKPTKNDGWLSGVTTADIVKIQRHIIGVEKITDPYYLIAADVNKSGSITAADISEIRSLVLGVTVTFKNNSSWVFVPALYVFPDPANPWNYPNQTVFNPLIKSERADFIGIKIGDVNGSNIGGFGDDGSADLRKNIDLIDKLYQEALAYEQAQVTKTELLTKPTLSIRPNPVHDHLYIDGLEKTNFFVRIYDTRGNEKCLYVVSDNSINMTKLPSGLYFVEVHTGSKVYVAKVIKIGPPP